MFKGVVSVQVEGLVSFMYEKGNGKETENSIESSLLLERVDVQRGCFSETLF